MQRFLDTLRICWKVYKIRTYGKYYHTLHTEEHNAAIYEYKGKLYAIPSISED